MAGAERVVGSLWRVDDEATRVLMERFYGAMLREKNPLAPADALREAALEVRAARGSDGRSFAAPRIWAAFVCYGR
jgi:CHAT domain-containing protein